MLLNLSRQEIWDILERMKQVVDVHKLEQGDPLLKLYFRLSGQVTDNA